MNLLNRLRHSAPLRRLLLLPAGTRPEHGTVGAPAIGFDPFVYFPGNTHGWGIVQGRRGTVVRRFEMTIAARTDGDTLTLDEQFRYSDGERDSRTWRIVRAADGRLTGTADDIIGRAAGTLGGDSMCWRYAMLIEAGGRRYRVHFDDRMWQLDANVLMNRSTVRKFGIRVADVTIFMQKASA